MTVTDGRAPDVNFGGAILITPTARLGADQLLEGSGFSSFEVGFGGFNGVVAGGFGTAIVTSARGVASGLALGRLARAGSGDSLAGAVVVIVLGVGEAESAEDFVADSGIRVEVGGTGEDCKGVADGLVPVKVDCASPSSAAE